MQQALDKFRAAANLTRNESTILSNTYTFDDLLNLTSGAQTAWKNKKHGKTRDAIQRRIAYCATLAENYKGMVEAVKSAQPTLGGLAFGMVGIVVKAVEEKHTKEGVMDEVSYEWFFICACSAGWVMIIIILRG